MININKILYACVGAMTLFGSIDYVRGVPNSEINASTSQRALKGDRLDIRPLGTACSQQTWPYYDNACLRDLRGPVRRVRAVRVVSADRLPITNPVAHLAK